MGNTFEAILATPLDYCLVFQKVSIVVSWYVERGVG